YPPFSYYGAMDVNFNPISVSGGWHWILFGAAYVASFLTAVNTWRMIFRAFFGEPVQEAAELAAGHLHHADVHTNPATGEEEDTDVGFPGPEHHIAEREPSMRAAMAVLAVLATIGGFLQIPFNAVNAIDNFLEPSFAGSKYYGSLSPSDGFPLLCLVIGAVLGLAGITLAYRVWVQQPGTAERVRARFGAAYVLFQNKWFFDELS